MEHIEKNQNKYLLLARRAIEEVNAEDSAKYYDMVRAEDPDNAEAIFFCSYYRIFNDTTDNAYENFLSLCNRVSRTIEGVMKSCDNDEERKTLINSILGCIVEACSFAVSENTDISGGGAEETD